MFGGPGADLDAEYAHLAPVATELSPREHEVLTMVARGHSNGETAEALDLSVETVKSHMRRVLGKLGARNRCHAVALAYDRGLLLVGLLDTPSGAPGPVRRPADP